MVDLHLPGKFLIFQLGEEQFAISVMNVREIMKMQDITSVPQAPHYVQGVLNLRGRIVPVVSLRRKFDMGEKENTELTCIVVVRLTGHRAEHSIGVVVDSVVEVLTLNPDDVEDAPDFGLNTTGSYVRGIAKVKGSVKILLDIDQVLGNEHFQ
jgi:purine-binding chemotaxis protein CheW